MVTGKSTATPGAPTKVDNSALIETICRIAISGSAADDRRRSEVIRTVKSLDDLTTSLRSEGFELSRSAVYLRLVPRNVRTIEVKRHVNVAPVKLSRPENSLHKNHVATKFARTSIRYLEEIAGFLDPEECTFHSEDDKAKVPIGLPAAKKHVPLLMHLEYKVLLPDHDFTVGALHKLIPSVIGVMEILPKKLTGDAVTYNGPTYIAIRSGKHTGSSAFHYLTDIFVLYCFRGNFSFEV